MDWGRREDNPLAELTYETIVLPIIFGFIAVFTPTFTKIGLGVFSVYLIISVFYIQYAKKRKLHEYPRWNYLHTVTHVNVAVLFAMTILWRAGGSSPWLIIVLVFIHMLSVFLGYRYREAVNRALRSPRRQKSRILTVVGGIGGGGAGLLTYVLTPAFPLFMLCLMYFGLLFVAAFFQAQWLYVEEPNWQPE